MAGITQPTLVASGDDDQMMHTKNSRLLAEALQGGLLLAQTMQSLKPLEAALER